ncbi:cupin domain-containing protein [Natrinema zhouii]|uniref:Cupin domain-containing protein n=1 Tax=Natrinema zhouii TaxID=1710539 RepID=A0A7D6CNJ3_9EURY|nr:cupin domain-containing protein [Natrinema zhouii]QLK25977.1 cupin domain-containing protein [Natrinema zhouii]
MLDTYADSIDDLEPADGEVDSTELIVSDDVLVKAFALGPGAELEAHEHADSTNVFHVLEGTVTVVQDDEREEIDAPGVVHHERGVDHGAENETDETVIFTASLCPMPS